VNHMSRYTSRGVFLLALVLITGLAFAYQYRQEGQVAVTNSAVGDRKLPIYCVDTTEKKVALSFDAAWGGGQMRITAKILPAYGPALCVRPYPIYSPAYSFASAMPSPT